MIIKFKILLHTSVYYKNSSSPIWTCAITSSNGDENSRSLSTIKWNEKQLKAKEQKFGNKAISIT